MLACGLSAARRDADRQPRRRHRRRQVRHRERRATTSCSPREAVHEGRRHRRGRHDRRQPVHGLNAIGIDDIIAVDDLTDGPKYATCSAPQISDYFDRSEFYARFARGELGQVDAVFHEGACSDTMEHDGRLMLDNNYRCSKTLLDACQAQGTRLLYASSAAIYGGSGVVPRGAGVRAAAQRLRLLQAAVRQRRAPHAAGGDERRSPAFATSTSTARASSTRGAWRRSRSITSTSSATTARSSCSATTAATAPASRRATSSSSTTWSPSTCGSSHHPEASGIFNLGSGRAQPFNDVAARGRQRGARASAARRRCRWPRWCAQGLIEYIDFPAGAGRQVPVLHRGRPGPAARHRLRPRVRRRGHRRRPLRRGAGAAGRLSRAGSTRHAPAAVTGGRRADRRRRAGCTASRRPAHPSPRSISHVQEIRRRARGAVRRRGVRRGRRQQGHAGRARSRSRASARRSRRTIIDERKKGDVQGLERPRRPRQGRRRQQRRQVLRPAA